MKRSWGFVLLFSLVFAQLSVMTMNASTLVDNISLQNDDMNKAFDITLPDDVLATSWDDSSSSIANAQQMNDDITIPFGGFIKNVGQVSTEDIFYFCTMGSMSVGFSESGVRICIQTSDIETANIEMSFSDANLVQPTAEFQKAHVVNYFLPEISVANVPTYDEIWYRGLYDGIDLRFYCTEDGIKYDFIVSPKADPTQIVVVIQGDAIINVGEDAVSFKYLDEYGPLLFQDSSIFVYQDDGKEIKSAFVKGNEIPNSYTYEIGSYDQGKTLVIDPFLVAVSSFLGTVADDCINDIVVDESGNILMTGYTCASGFPTINAIKSTHTGGADCFVMKMNPEATAIIFSTYIGRYGQDIGYGIDVDSTGNVYVIGDTTSYDFPLVNPVDSDYENNEVFLFKLSSTGDALLASTFLGGCLRDYGTAIAVDRGSSWCYITGNTESDDFPFADNLYNSGFDTFTARISTDLQTVDWLEYYGGSSEEFATGIAYWGDFVYSVGYTYSNDLYQSHAYDSTYNGMTDIFIAAWQASSPANHYPCSYLGTSNTEYANSIAIDADGKIYIGGFTWSPHFPILNGYQTTHGGYSDAILVRFDNPSSHSGNLLLDYSTFLGGEANDWCFDISVSSDNDKVSMVGSTYSNLLPIVNTSILTRAGGKEGFVASFSISSMDTPNYITYYGGSADESFLACAIGSDGTQIVAGSTSSSGFPINNAYDSTYNGMLDGCFMIFEYDNNAPSISLASPINGSYHDSSFVANVDISDENLDYVLYSLSGYSCNYSWSEPYTKTILATKDGTKWLHVYAVDTYGQWSEAHYLFYIDVIAPIIALENPSNNTIQHSGTVIDFQVTDVYLTSVEYHWDSDSFVSLTSPYQVILPSTPGPHTLYIRAEDIVNHISTTTFIFTVNDTPPEITLISPSMATGWHSGTCINLTVAAAGGTIDQVLYNWDGKTNLSLSNPYDVYLPAGNGLHILSLYVHDTVGGWGSEFFVFRTQDTVWLSFSTYLGGNGRDDAFDVTIDDEGYVYLVGRTISTNFPLKNAFDGTYSSTDAFVTKFLPNGSDVIFSTYLGGSGSDSARGVAVDIFSNCYIVGATGSSDFPILNAYDSTPRNSFLTKFNETGGLVFSTYFGADGGLVEVEDILIGLDGIIYITGETSTVNLPLMNAIDSTLGGSQDIFITAFNQTGNGLIFSTYFGGEGAQSEEAKEIAIGANGFIYVTGYTGSTSFNTTPDAYDRVHDGGIYDGYLIVLNATGTGLLYSTLLGGTGTDEVQGMCIDTGGRVLITGYTTGGFPTSNAIQSTYGGGTADGFIMRLNSTLNGIDFSTYFGGDQADRFYDVSNDIYGRIYVGGSSSSLMQTYNALNDTMQGGGDAILLILDPSGSDFVSLSYYGGSSGEIINEMFQDSSGNCYICGSTGSSDYPLKNAYQSTYGGGTYDCFLVSLTIDDIAPSIECIPASGSSITSYDDIVVSVNDGISGISHVTYYWDDEANTTLEVMNREEEFIVGFSGEEGIHAFHILANDTFGNSIEETFIYTLDDSLPVLLLMTPANETIHPSGVVLDFEIYDLTEVTAHYYWDAASSNSTLAVPYDLTIPTGEGLHILHLYVTDATGHEISQSYVFFTDNIAPSISSPSDLTFSESTTGHSISWTLTDTMPSFYVLLMNDTIIQSGAWNSTGEVIMYSVDGFTIGIYNFTLSIFDMVGHISSDEVIVTVVDELPPIISHPIDASYIYGATGMTLMWSGSDIYPQSYTLFRDNVVIASSGWAGESIQTSLNGLLPGIHNYTLVLVDQFSNSISDTVFITITDIIIPTVDHPLDISYEAGTTGNIITWSPSDETPYWYFVYENGLLVEDQTWDGSDISISVDGLDVGTHNYTLVVQDMSGNIVRDTVIITVTPAEGTTTTTTGATPEEFNLMSIAIIGTAISAILLVVIILQVKRRSTSS